MVEQQIKPREYYLDAVKSIAIILTVLGHCIHNDRIRCIGESADSKVGCKNSSEGIEPCCFTAPLACLMVCVGVCWGMRNDVNKQRKNPNLYCYKLG